MLAGRLCVCTHLNGWGSLTWDVERKWSQLETVSPRFFSSGFLPGCTMPQQPSRSGEDDGPPDETKTYHTEGEQEEKINENAAGVRESFDHLNDVKSSLVNEGESSSSSSKPNTSSQVRYRVPLAVPTDQTPPDLSPRSQATLKPTSFCLFIFASRGING